MSNGRDTGSVVGIREGVAEIREGVEEKWNMAEIREGVCEI